MVGEATSIAKVPYKAYEEQKAFGRGSPGIFMEVDVNWLQLGLQNSNRWDVMIPISFRPYSWPWGYCNFALSGFLPIPSLAPSSSCASTKVTQFVFLALLTVPWVLNLGWIPRLLTHCTHCRSPCLGLVLCPGFGLAGLQVLDISPGSITGEEWIQTCFFIPSQACSLAQ